MLRNLISARYQEGSFVVPIDPSILADSEGSDILSDEGEYSGLGRTLRSSKHGLNFHVNITY